MELNFTKMHGLGNDFMVVPWPEGEELPGADQIRGWANRRTGVGFDQLLLLGGAKNPDSHGSYRVFNADGEEVEQCGNGARCIVKYLAKGSEPLRLDSAAGPIVGVVEENGSVRIDLGVPNFDPQALPFSAQPSPSLEYSLEIDGETVHFAAVSVGNPHVVLQVNSVDDAPVGILGPQLERHPAFPKGTNVGLFSSSTPAGCACVCSNGALEKQGPAGQGCRSSCSATAARQG